MQPVNLYPLVQELMMQRIQKRVAKEFPCSTIRPEDIQLRIEGAVFLTEKLSKKFKGTYKTISGLKGFAKYKSKKYYLYCTNSGEYLDMTKEEKIKAIPFPILKKIKKDFKDIEVLRAFSLGDRFEFHFIQNGNKYYCASDLQGHKIDINMGSQKDIS